MMEAPSLPIAMVCEAGELRVLLSEIAQRRFPQETNTLLFFEPTGTIQQTLRNVRNLHGGLPLGVVVADEAAGLVALESGADDAITSDHLDAATAFGFIERVILRARLRREQEQLSALYVHSEKLAALGTLVAGVAHEVNNPLTSLLLSAEGLKLRVSPLHNALEEVDALVRRKDGATHEELQRILRVGRTGSPIVESRELLQEIEASARSIARVVRDLKLFSRPDDDVAPEIVDIRGLVDQVLRIVGRQIRAHGTIEIDYQPDLPPVVAPTARLAQVFTNILLNAAYAVTEIERPAHRIRISARADEEAVAVCVSDTGPGIAPNVLGRIFDPFFTTKRDGVGTGLGLSISRSILRRIGGDLLVESVHGDGATFIALIPRPNRSELYDAHRRRSRTASNTAQTRANKRVLVLDSDEQVLRAFARALDSQYDLLLARDSDEAIELLASGSHADVIVADISPPDRPGVALHDWIERERGVRAQNLVFVTAEESRPSRLLESGNSVLHKPVSRSQLLEAVSAVLTAQESQPPLNRC
ncbi:MAG: ATP-binding protein [Polyangiaceae bacterium]